jgi:hypothetical protein
MAPALSSTRGARLGSPFVSPRLAGPTHVDQRVRHEECGIVRHMTDDPKNDDSSAYRAPADPRVDWIGTVSAQETSNIGDVDLYDTAGLDRKQWSILGFDIGTFRGQSSLDVFALDTALFEVSDHDDLKALASTQDTLPVTRFSVPLDSGLDDFFKKHFKSFYAVLTFQSVAGKKLQVVDEKQAPSR